MWGSRVGDLSVWIWGGTRIVLRKPARVKAVRATVLDSCYGKFLEVMV